MTNDANDYVMEIGLTMTVGTNLVVNTSEKEITLYDGSNQINALIDMPVRDEWFPLLPAVDNVITINVSGSATFIYSWEDRSL